MPDVLSNAVVMYLYSNLACVQVRRFSGALRIRMSEANFQQPAAISYWDAIKANGYRYLNHLDVESKRLAVYSEREYKRLQNAIGSSERAIERARRDGEMSYANWLVSASRVLLDRLKKRGFIKSGRADEPIASKVVIESRMFSGDYQSPPVEQAPLHQQPKWDDASVEDTEASNLWDVLNCLVCRPLSLMCTRFSLSA